MNPEPEDLCRTSLNTSAFRRARLDYQNGHVAGADSNLEKLTGRRSMTLDEFAKLHADQLNAG
jgi:hypothetical protein